MTAWPMIAVLGLALFGLSLWLTYHRVEPTAGANSRAKGQEFWILAVWFLGMLAATPLYHPYLRLTVPLLLATFLGAGLGIQLIFEGPLFDAVRIPDHSTENLVESESVAHGRRRWSLPSLLLAMCCVLALSTLAGDLSSLACFADRTGLVTVGREIKSTMQSRNQNAEGEAPTPVVYVFAEPALLFQLRLAGVEVVAPAGSLGFAEARWGTSTAPVYLATGIHAGSDPAFQEQFAKLRNRLKPVGQWPWHLSPLVSLDQPDARPSKVGSDPAESATVELFEVIGE
jgi:hypothetical protein